MVKESSVVAVVMGTLASEATTEDFSDVVYGETVYSSVDRANIKVAKALKALCSSQNLENEVALAQALVGKLVVLAYLKEKENEDQETAKAEKLAKKLAKTVECAHAVANDPEVKRTRRTRVKDVVLGESNVVSCIPTATAEVDVVKVKEAIVVRAAERITDTDDVLGAIGTPKQQAVFTEVEDLPKQAVNVSGEMDDFIRSKKAKLEALAALSQDKEPSL